jgi:adenylate cyclase
MWEATLYRPDFHRQVPLDGGRLALDAQGGPCARESQNVAMVLEEATEGERALVRVTSHGPSVVLGGGQRIVGGMTRELPLPAQFWLSQTTVYVHPADCVQPVDAALRTFPRLANDPADFAQAMKQLGAAPSAHTLAYWFDALCALQRTPAGSRECYDSAVRALFEPGGFDAALLLTREGSDWQVAASYVVQPHAALHFRRTIVERSCGEKATVYHDSRAIAQCHVASGEGYVAASPVLNAEGDVAAVLYGVRFHHSSNQRRGVRPLEAQFVQAVADAVTAGFVRAEREAEVAKLHSRLELAFSPLVARQLEVNPRLLDPKEREVTVLVCDLRDFTSLTERLTPRESFALLADVMDRFTLEITARQGLVLDYFGDGLAAFWNAPLEVPGHAEQAYAAAQAMLGVLPEISDDWFAITGRRLRVGIGLHTAISLIGNAGSRTRIKYGPRGSVLNLASRVQAHTKVLGVPLLMTAFTAERLDPSVNTSCIDRAMLEGFVEPIALHAPVAMLDCQTSRREAEPCPTR